MDNAVIDTIRILIRYGLFRTAYLSSHMPNELRFAMSDLNLLMRPVHVLLAYTKAVAPCVKELTTKTMHLDDNRLRRLRDAVRSRLQKKDVRCFSLYQPDIDSIESPFDEIASNNHLLYALIRLAHAGKPSRSVVLLQDALYYSAQRIEQANFAIDPTAVKNASVLLSVLQPHLMASNIML